jgi:hypothetical protein
MANQTVSISNQALVIFSIAIIALRAFRELAWKEEETEEQKRGKNHADKDTHLYLILSLINIYPSRR